MALLEIENLSVDFQTGGGLFRAVDNVSIKVDAGEILAVVGESGSGKSVAMVEKGIQPNAVTLVNPDFQLLSKAYGCRFERPFSLRALGPAIKTALAADGPTLIELTPQIVNG